MGQVQNWISYRFPVILRSSKSFSVLPWDKVLRQINCFLPKSLQMTLHDHLLITYTVRHSGTSNASALQFCRPVPKQYLETCLTTFFAILFKLLCIIVIITITITIIIIIIIIIKKHQCIAWKQMNQSLCKLIQRRVLL